MRRNEKPKSPKPDIKPIGQRPSRKAKKVKTKKAIKQNRTANAKRIAARRRIGCPGVSMFKMKDLEPAGYNPREIDAEALEGLTNSISRFGGVEHPTVKPVEVFAIPMRVHTSTGAICYEPFCGSGSQIIAAEKLDRRCYAMETEPVFVDVAVERWERWTGTKAKRTRK